MLECPPRRGYDSRRRIQSVIAALLGDATHAIATVLVAAIGIAVGNVDGGVEGYTCSHYINQYDGFWLGPASAIES